MTEQTENNNSAFVPLLPSFVVRYKRDSEKTIYSDTIFAKGEMMAAQKLKTMLSPSVIDVLTVTRRNLEDADAGAIADATTSAGTS